MKVRLLKKIRKKYSWKFADNKVYVIYKMDNNTVANEYDDIISACNFMINPELGFAELCQRYSKLYNRRVIKEGRKRYKELINLSPK